MNRETEGGAPSAPAVPQADGAGTDDHIDSVDKLLAMAGAAPCRHGWRGSPAERISTRCPACGGESLFVGSGGHLTCGRLDCPEPSLAAEIENLRAGLTEALLTLVAIAAQPATLDRLWADNPTLGTTLARVRKALRQMEPTDPLAPRRAS